MKSQQDLFFEAIMWQVRSYKEAKDQVGVGTKKAEKAEDRPHFEFHKEETEEERKWREENEELSKKFERKPEPRSKKHTKHFSGARSERKSQIDQRTQLKPTALEVIDYKVGTQGYPENVEAFEREVSAQAPTISLDLDRLSSQQLRAEYESATVASKSYWVELWVMQMLEKMRFPKPTQVKKGKPEKKIIGMKGGDFSKATIDWFINHPADLLWLSRSEHKTEAKKWAGFKGGIKSRGGGRPRKNRTQEEKREAHRLYQQKRAKEARR